MTLTRNEYATRCLYVIGGVEDREHHVALQARIIQEWGSLSGHGPAFNALDLTQYEHGATPFNSFGPGNRYHVWNYPDLFTGARAFHDILDATEYTEVVHLLRTNGATALEIINAWNKTPWGYCDPDFVFYAADRFHYYADLLVKT